MNQNKITLNKPTLKIYGFGSYFRKEIQNFNDIDILILHPNCSILSCSYAIQLKKKLLEKMEGLDIVMLSESEEKQLKFIDKSNAVFIGVVNDLIDDFESIIFNILSVKTFKNWEDNSKDKPRYTLKELLAQTDYETVGAERNNESLKSPQQG